MTDDNRPDLLTQALLAARPELAGHVHLVNGRPWCDGINHTTMCDPAHVQGDPCFQFCAVTAAGQRYCGSLCAGYGKHAAHRCGSHAKAAPAAG